MVAAACAALIYGPELLAPAPSAGEAKSSDTPPATPVVAESVEVRPERTRIQAVGTSRARLSVTLHPNVAGRVTAVNFAPGQRVKAGTVLVELDRREETLALELARVRRADAERELDRYERTSGSGAVTVAALDAARTAAQLARLEVQRAEVALSDRLIRAPFDGYIGITEVDPGDRVDTDTPIATLDDRSELLVSFEVPELFLGRLSVGQPVTVTAWSAKVAKAQGRIVDIGARVDPESRTFAVRAGVNNSDDGLRPGMSFRVNLDLEGRPYPVVPEVSLQWGGDGSYVWAVRDGRARSIPVSIVQRVQGRVLVDAGLAEGETVVTEGVQSMREGLPVRPVDARLAEANDPGADSGAEER
jgi:RND family efflux transporter MFP subunit